VRRNKNDAADAAAICEAATRPDQRFVAAPSVENQAGLMRHRTRELLIGQRTALINALRGHLAEIGVVAAQGACNAYDLKRLLKDGADAHGEILVPECVCAALRPLGAQIDALDATIAALDKAIEAGVKADEHGEVVVPACVCAALRPLGAQIDALDATIAAIDKEIEAAVKGDEQGRRLMTIPGIGPLTAAAILSTVPDMSAFSSGREFAAFLGLTPSQHSTGGKERLGHITKMGDRYLRKLLVVGACAVIRHREGHNDALRRWVRSLLERKPLAYRVKLTAVALANKLARIVFAIVTRGGRYDDRPVAA